jgi:hypothetical protein
MARQSGLEAEGPDGTRTAPGLVVNARLTTRVRKLVVGTGATIVAGLAAAAVVHYSLAWHNSQSNANLVGTVQIAVDDNICRRLVIDHRTGTVKSDEHVPCSDPAKKDARAPKEARTQKESPRGQKQKAAAPSQDGSEPSRYSSDGRIEAVRKSFTNR